MGVAAFDGHQLGTGRGGSTGPGQFDHLVAGVYAGDAEATLGQVGRHQPSAAADLQNPRSGRQRHVVDPFERPGTTFLMDHTEDGAAVVQRAPLAGVGVEVCIYLGLMDTLGVTVVRCRHPCTPSRPP